MDRDKLIEQLENASAAELSELIVRIQEMHKQAAEREEDERRKQLWLEEERQAHAREVTSMELPLDWENVFASDERAKGIHADNAADGLMLSLSNLGRVDIEYIAEVTGEDCKSVIGALKGTIYQNPDTWDECFYKGWETADQYLSGNLKRKWDAACRANEEYLGYFADNVKAIEAVIPPTVSFRDIYITIGSPWVPTDVIDEFMIYMLGNRYAYYNYKARPTRHDEWTGSWEIPDKNRYGEYNVAVTQKYGTKRVPALYLLEKALNMKTPVVYDEDNTGGGKRTVNQTETLAAVEKQQELIRLFQDWVWSDPGRKERLVRIYEGRFSCVRTRRYDGSWLTFPTMSPEVSLYPYQKDAVARILFSPNTLLAHEVGAGKTYVMIAAGMELMRMGLSDKNLYVVPNNLIGQWRTIFLTMYPQANLLCVEPKNFTPKKREDMLEKIRDEHFDGIIMAYSCFGEIPLSKYYYLQRMKGEEDVISRLMIIDNKVTPALKKRETYVKDAIRKLMDELSYAYDGVYFDELGITRLFVDEAHNFKNIPIRTKVNNVLGITSVGSAKCKDMLDKVRCVERDNKGGGVVMATGTPITNSLTDIYVMQTYLQSGELAMLELESFDSWIGMFAERVTEFEVDVDTSRYRLATRFSHFHNLPELTSLLSSIADFHSMHSAEGMPGECEYREELIGKTPEFEDYLEDISYRAEMVRAGVVSPSDDNMLKITTDGRKAALDMRLVDPLVAFTYQNKASRCAARVTELYWHSAAQQGTQLIFCDTSVPKAAFNLYDEMKRLLVANGIPEEEIAYVHEADTEKKREALYERVRSGEIRVLIGSTFKIGLGVNVQDRMVALHHLDVPWRPADMIQREGRILRPGNRNSQVYIYRYVTEGSFDSYSWQLLETKQHMISELLSSSIGRRSSEDVEDTVLNYAEVKALAVGDPLIRRRIEAENLLNRTLSLQRRLMESRADMEEELLSLPAALEDWQEKIDRCRQDMDFRDNGTGEKEFDTKAARNRYRSEMRKLLRSEIRKNILETKERVLTEYRGFEIILPANMTAEKPYVWLRHFGKYYVELGDSESGDLVRVDHRIDHLDENLEKFEQKKESLIARQIDLNRELENREDYSDAINAYREELDMLDKELGVN